MNVIEIIALSSGAHRNTQDINYIPEGYAQIPDDMPLPDIFPFVNIEVADEVRYTEKSVYNEATGETKIERIPYTVKVVASMTEGIVPPPDPVPEKPENNQLTAEQMAAAIMEGVNSI